MDELFDFLSRKSTRSRARKLMTLPCNYLNTNGLLPYDFSSFSSAKCRRFSRKLSQLYIRDDKDFPLSVQILVIPWRKSVFPEIPWHSLERKGKSSVGVRPNILHGQNCKKDPCCLTFLLDQKFLDYFLSPYSFEWACRPRTQLIDEAQGQKVFNKQTWLTFLYRRSEFDPLLNINWKCITWRWEEKQ